MLEPSLYPGSTPDIVSWPQKEIPQSDNRFPGKFHAPAAIVESIAEQAEMESEQNELDSRPALREARARASTNINSQALHLLLMSNENLGADKDNKLANRLASFKAMLDSRKQQAGELATAIDNASRELQGALAELETATGDLNAKQQLLEEVKQQLASLKSELAALQQQGVSADDPRYIALSEKIDKTKDAISRADAAVTQAEEKLMAQEDATVNLLQKHGALVEKLYVQYATVIDSTQLKKAQQQELTLAAEVTKRLALMIGVFGEGNLTKLRNDRELIEKQSEAVRTKMTEAAKLEAEQAKKAAEINRIGNCVAKILGGVLMALGTLSLVFGGAGSVLMVIGIGMMVADPVCKALFGFSPTEKVMGPLMEHVFTPLMKAIEKLVGEVLATPPLSTLLEELEQATGTQIIGTVQTVVAAAVTVAVIIAVAFFVKSAGQAMFEKFGKALTQAVVEQIKNALKTVLQHLPAQLKNVGTVISQQLKALLEQLSAQIAKKLPAATPDILNLTNNSLALTKVASDTATGMTSAAHSKASQEAGIEVQFSKTVMDQLKDSLNVLMNLMKSNSEAENNMIATMTSVQQSSDNVAMSILKNSKM